MVEIRLGRRLQCLYVLARMTLGVMVIAWILHWFYLMVYAWARSLIVVCVVDERDTFGTLCCGATAMSMIPLQFDGTTEWVVIRAAMH